MEFSNRENEKVTLPDGRIVFLSRSVAVVACVVCVEDGIPYVLVGERGEAVDNSGKWCMPCGYLDWDETLDQAVLREVFEETGFSLASIGTKQIIYKDERIPHEVISTTDENRQNVAHIFGVMFRGSLPKIDPSAAIATGEVVRAMWMKLEEMELYEFAFKHDKRISAFINMVGKKVGINFSPW